MSKADGSVRLLQFYVKAESVLMILLTNTCLFTLLSATPFNPWQTLVTDPAQLRAIYLPWKASSQR